MLLCRARVGRVAPPFSRLQKYKFPVFLSPNLQKYEFPVFSPPNLLRFESRMHLSRKCSIRANPFATVFASRARSGAARGARGVPAFREIRHVAPTNSCRECDFRWKIKCRAVFNNADELSNCIESRPYSAPRNASQRIGVMAAPVAPIPRRSRRFPFFATSKMHISSLSPPTAEKYQQICSNSGRERVRVALSRKRSIRASPFATAVVRVAPTTNSRRECGFRWKMECRAVFDNAW